MTLWPFRPSPALNTLDLSGDGDEVHLLEDVEKCFAIRLEQKDVEGLASMADLENLVAGKRGNRSPSGEDWQNLCQIARLHTGQSGQIDRNTTLFAKFARPKEIENG